nr:MAG TPA: hypothetical protein [Caudoviricetes sp.]
MCFYFKKKKDDTGSNLSVISKRDMLQPLTLWLQYTWIVVSQWGVVIPLLNGMYNPTVERSYDRVYLSV